MATKITRNVIESYLNCKYKGHLKLAGENGTPSDYETMTTGARTSSREQAIARLVARFGGDNDCRGLIVTTALLTQGVPLLTDAQLEDDAISLRFDALRRADGASALGDHHYVPVVHNHLDKVSRWQKMLLAVLGLVLGSVQGQRPAIGLVVIGVAGRLRKVRLDAKLYSQAKRVLDEVKRLQAGGGSPRLTLNAHCQACEFRQRCRKQAEEADDISLLSSLSANQVATLRARGIFTVTQYSFLYLPPRQSEAVRWEEARPRPPSLIFRTLLPDARLIVTAICGDHGTLLPILCSC
jgi:predicted RecB family nuclease